MNHPLSASSSKIAPYVPDGAAAGNIAESGGTGKVNERHGARHVDLLGHAGHAAPGLPGFSSLQPLPIPGVMLAPDEVLLASQAVVDAVHSQQAKNIIENLRQSSESIDKANKEKMKSLLDRMDKTLKALEKQKAMTTLGDATFGVSIAVTILSIIGAGLLSFVTGGLATPLLVGTAIGAVNTLLDGIDRALQNDPKAKYGAGVLEGKQISVGLAGLISTSHEAILKSIPEFKGLPKAQQELILAVLQVVTSLVVSISVSAVGAVAGAKAAANAAGNIIGKSADLASMAMKATAQLVSTSASTAATVGEIIQVAANIATAFIGAFLAGDRVQMNLADNKSQKFTSIAEMEGRIKDVLQEILEKVMEDKDATAETISKALRAYHDTQASISRPN